MMKITIKEAAKPVFVKWGSLTKGVWRLSDSTTSGIVLVLEDNTRIYLHETGTIKRAHSNGEGDHEYVRLENTDINISV